MLLLSYWLPWVWGKSPTSSEPHVSLLLSSSGLKTCPSPTCPNLPSFSFPQSRDVTYSLPSTQITRNTVTCKFTLCSEACDLLLPKAAVLRRILKVPSRRMSGRADSARSSRWGSRSDLFDLQLGGPGRAFIGWEAGHGLYQSQTAYPCCA